MWKQCRNEKDISYELAPTGPLRNESLTEPPQPQELVGLAWVSWCKSYWPHQKSCICFGEAVLPCCPWPAMLFYKEYLNTIVKPLFIEITPQLTGKHWPRGSLTKISTKVPQALAKYKEGLQLSMIFLQKIWNMKWSRNKNFLESENVAWKQKKAITLLWFPCMGFLVLSYSQY